MCVPLCFFFWFIQFSELFMDQVYFFGVFFSLVGEKSDPDKFWRYFFFLLFFRVLCSIKG